MLWSHNNRLVHREVKREEKKCNVLDVKMQRSRNYRNTDLFSITCHGEGMQKSLSFLSLLLGKIKRSRNGYHIGFIGKMKISSCTHFSMPHSRR